MWLLQNDSFLSVVSNPDDDKTLLVRARREGDITNVFPDAVVTKTPRRDYLYRAFIPREEVGKAIAERIENIGYPNFKGSVRNNALHDAYMSVWNLLGRLQKGGPYGAGNY
jgi:hypothetical protein